MAVVYKTTSLSKIKLNDFGIVYIKNRFFLYVFQCLLIESIIKHKTKQIKSQMKIIELY